MAMEQLLELLQEQATLTPAQLASMLGEQEEDVVKAIKKYEKEGIIKGYHAAINWERTEVPRATALIELRVTPQKDTGFDEIAGRVMNFPEVESVYLMSGGYDLAVTVTGKTMSDIAMFVAKRLAPIGGVLSTATHFVLTKYKDGGVVFADEAVVGVGGFLLAFAEDAAQSVFVLKPAGNAFNLVIGNAGQAERVESVIIGGGNNRVGVGQGAVPVENNVFYTHKTSDFKLYLNGIGYIKKYDSQ